MCLPVFFSWESGLGMKKILSICQKIENAIMVVTFVTMVATFFAQVLNRNFFQAPGFSWFEELATYCQIYMVLIGTEIGLRDGTQVSVTAVVDRFQGKKKKIIQMVSKLIVIVFSGVLAFSTVKLLRVQLLSGQTSSAMHIPMFIPYFALTLSFSIITLVQSAMLFAMLKDFVSGDGGGRMTCAADGRADS